ncbi:MAG TPA: bifunctional UDP-N-acetylglucosamine diphosphorylase/glucosamine-1-phosphate N-acetyltransferase GlmU [Solirubrobacteraceae bacterium]|nr:bifunctional UDP-N-acetylglucosamine diphosphorylase/glucosamine-1-phosphate N-acetyltransferase GlmU [Solirubrobacteraceae bacterium]
MSGPVVVILAAGQGTRMRSRTPKLLHDLCGRPMIGWAVAAARAAGASRIVVVDAPGEPLREALEPDVVSVVQPEPLGTGDALRAARDHIDPEASVVVLNGDVPLISPHTVAALGRTQRDSGAAAVILTAELEDPTGYGRVVRGADGSVERVVETKQPEDATAAQLALREINSGVYAFAGGALVAALARVGNDNAQGEYYLPDVLPLLRGQGHVVTALELDEVEEILGVNDRVQLAAVRALAQRRINEALMRAGATIIDPDHTVIDLGVTLAPDTLIHPGCALHGATSVGEGSVIGPRTTLVDVTVGADSTVIHSHAVGAQIGDRVSVGPFAYLRPGTVLREGAKAGTFVEIKNSEVGARSKVPHLSYIGDATIGEDSNLGASTITANYDGYRKHRTTIGARVHTHVHTTLVAPVRLGDDSFAGAGSVITKPIPPGALGIARERQRNIENYADRVREREAAAAEAASGPSSAGEAASGPSGSSAPGSADPGPGGSR